jgi:MoaA/NifB/PqqE/SkfB family radical SAM enzyme
MDAHGPERAGVLLRESPAPLTAMLFFKKKKTPFCTAFHTSLVVDPDKGVRPCCTFDGHLGNLKQDSLADVLAGPTWKAAIEQVEAGGVPEGCVKCLERERKTGWSVRSMYMKEARSIRDGSWRKGLTELEINSSSICNLACTHCNVNFSSRWVKQVKDLEQRGVPHYRRVLEQIHQPDPVAMRKHLEGLDLRHLQIARFKGGEPMLNEDVPVVLRYLDEIGVLKRVTVNMVSNGSLVDPEVRALLSKAGHVAMCISVDGVAGVQEYIRRGPSEIERIEAFIESFAELANTTFDMSCSVMAYNVFHLERIADWWLGHARRWPTKFGKHRFALHVVEPLILSVDVLQDETRRALREKYAALDNADYASVLQALSQPWAGARIHDDFVAYTRGMDELNGTDVEALIPELAHELVFVEPGRAA